MYAAARPPRTSDMKRKSGAQHLPGALSSLWGQVPNDAFLAIAREASKALEGGAPSRRRVSSGFRDTYEPLFRDTRLQKKDGSDYVWTHLDPNRLLAHVVDKCQDLAEAYGRAANERLPTEENPWNLLINFIEFVPGNKLQTSPSRKSMVLGFNFRELGEEILTKDIS